MISLCRDSFAATTEFVTKWCLSTWQTAPMEPGLVCVTRGISKSTEYRLWSGIHFINFPDLHFEQIISLAEIICAREASFFFIFSPDLIDVNPHVHDP